MTTTEVRELTDPERVDRAVEFLRELWDHRPEDEVRSWLGEDDYHLIGLVAVPGGTSGGAPSAGDGGGDDGRDGDGDDRGGDDGRGGVGDDRQLLGVAGVRVARFLHHERHAWLNDLVVDPDRRRQGHGTALLEGVIAWAEARDCEHVSLVVTPDNDAGRAFYEARGLEPFGTVMELAVTGA